MWRRRALNRHEDVELLETKTVHRGHFFDVHVEEVRLPSGLQQRLDVIEHPGAVCIAPVLDDGRLLLVRQYRHPVGEWLVEVPAGRLERTDTDRLEAAQRELEEETGHRAGRWEEALSFYVAPGFCSERMTLFVARELEAVAGGGLPQDDDEEVDVVRMRPEEVLAQCEDAKTLVAVQHLLRTS